jgi:hypothetical protein
MEEILYIENVVILSLVQNELDKMGIKYFIKNTDISTIPSNLNKDYIAILFSEIENKNIIIEIYDNIKSEHIIENQNNNSGYNNSNKIMKNIILLFIFVFMIGIIIYQNIMYKDLRKYLNNPLSIYEYKYLNNGKEMEIYLKKENRLLEKHFDNNRNGIKEKVIIYGSNDLIYIYEDANENLYYENIKIYRDNELLIEYISINDDGIYDITHYYDNGIIKYSLYYDSINNEIIIK